MKTVPICLTLILGLSSISAKKSEPQVVDRIVAVVEDQIVTLRELEKKAQPFLEKLASIDDAAERKTQRASIMRRVLDIEVDDRIVDKEIIANKEKLGITSKDVDRAIEEVLRSNNITRDQLQAAIYGQGMTWSEYRKILRKQQERARLVQFNVQGKVQVKESEARRRCAQRQGASSGGEQICASHILVEIPDDSSDSEIEKIRVTASRMQAEINSGADFAAYAMRHSADKSAPDGNLGCFSKGEMVDGFEKAAFAAKVGTVTPVVRTPLGFHIIKVNDRRHKATPCDSAEALLPFQNEIYQEQMEEQMKVWISELRQKAFVEIRL